MERARQPLTKLCALLEEKLTLLGEEEPVKEDAMQPMNATGLAESPAEQCLDDGLELYEQGKWDEARKTFVRGLQLKPDHVDLLVHLGLCEMMYHNTEMALAHFDRAATFGQQEADRLIASDPTEYIKECDRPPEASTGTSEEENMDDDLPTPLYSHLEFRPFFRALTNKAVALIDQKRYEEAIETLLLCQSYQALDGTFNMIGACYLSLGDVETASRWHREMLWAEARYVTALIQFRLGKTEDALENLLIGIPWNPHIGRMLAGIEKPDTIRYHGALRPWHEASEFMHRDGHLFRSDSGFKALVHCVLDDPAIDELLAELTEVEQRLKAERGYRRPEHVMQFVNGCPEESFLSHHAPRLLARFQESGGPYWLPREGDVLSVTVVEQKSQNWRVHLHGCPSTAFYFRPKGLPLTGSVDSTIGVRVAKSWRYKRNLYVSGTVDTR